MKDFLKYTLATVTGLIITSLLGSILMFVIIVGVIASSSVEKETKITEESVFNLKLNGNIVERDNESLAFFEMLEDKKTLSLDNIITSIKKAKEQDQIKGIYLDIDNFSAGVASLTEIRNALQKFKESGKFIVAYADQYTQGGYYLASTADNIYINPQGSIDWKGLSATTTFYADLFEMIGVKMQIFKVGTYKSAVEPFIQTKMSAANREQIKVFLDDTWSSITDAVSNTRGISVDKLNLLADEMQTFKQAKYYVENQLVDSLVYRTDMEDILKKRTNNDDIEKVSLKTMNQAKQTIDKEAQKIAIYYANGAIVDAGSSFKEESLIVGSKMVSVLNKLKDNDEIKGVVIRVNSPGGSAFASEQIWKAITDLKAKKPVTISMGDYAASGGYYISAAADYIVAEPTTLTGSIGIFAMIPNTEQLTNNIGIGFDTVKTNKHADFAHNGRALTADEKNSLQNYVENGYELFVKRCADGRKMSTDGIKEIAEGRVWTGKRALELGLVDELGGIDQAIAKVVEESGIAHYKAVKYPKKVDFITKIISSNLMETMQMSILPENLKALLKETKYLEHLSKESILQARLPYTLDIR